MLIPISFPLVTTPASTDSGVVSRPYARDALLRSPHGFGLLAPLRRDGKGDFAATGGEALVRSRIAELLGIRGDSEYTSGEMPWRTEAGSVLYLLRQRNNDPTIQHLARVHIAGALERWEPSVRLKGTTFTKARASATPDPENVLIIRLLYDILSGGGGNVLVPDVNQTLEV